MPFETQSVKPTGGSKQCIDNPLTVMRSIIPVKMNSNRKMIISRITQSVEALRTYYGQVYNLD